MSRGVLPVHTDLFQSSEHVCQFQGEIYVMLDYYYRVQFYDKSVFLFRALEQKVMDEVENRSRDRILVGETI